MESFLPYAHQSISEADISAVAQALQGERITRGENVAALEQEVAQYVGSRYAIAFSSGSAALACAFQAARVGPSDRIVSSPNTFITSVARGVELGAKLHLVDIDAYGNMDISLLPDIVNVPYSRGKTIIVPVHYAGVALDMKALDELIRIPEVMIIEDAAHALGSFYPDGQKVGSCAYSDMTIFSFHPAKNITTAEGGMVTTNDRELAERLKVARDSGIQRTSPWYYEVEQISCNYHMSELHAALGRSQLKRIDQFRAAKDRLITAYRNRFERVPGLHLPPDGADARTHYHLFQVHIEFEPLQLTRDLVMESLAAAGIGTQYHYVPLYRNPCLHLPSQGYPTMESHFARSLSIPFFSSMTEKDVDRVSSALRRILYKVYE